MNSMMQKVSYLAAAAMFAGAAAGAQSAPASGATAHTSTCGLAEQSTNDQGKLVIVAQCTGDLPGVLTLVVNDPQAAALSGEWALNVSYTAPLHPNAPLDSTTGGDPDAAQGEQLIQKGTISGVIQGGTASTVGTKVVLLNGVQLGLQVGSMQFAGVTKNSGSGAVSASSLDDRAASTSTVSLTF